MLKATYPPAIKGTRSDQDGENAQQNEPKSLIEVRLEGEAKARPRVVPDAIVVACDDAKGIAPRRKPSVVGGSAVTRITPVFFEAIETILKERALRHQQTQARIVKFPLLRAGSHFCPSGEGQRRSVDEDLLDMHGRRQSIGANVVGIHPHDTAHAWEPHQAIRCTNPCGGVATT